MIKAGVRTASVTKGRVPSWILDKENQKTWNGQFIGILKRDYSMSDAAISAILSDERLSQLCATKIRTYMDKDITVCLYEKRKARGANSKKQLQIAVAGLGEAINLYVDLGNQKVANILGPIKDDLSQALGRCKDAFSTKRHGRDRSHAILLECHSFLEAELRRPVTYASLASLVNAGFEADGNFSQKPVDEEQIRKNLANFKHNNPLWHIYGSTEPAPS